VTQFARSFKGSALSVSTRHGSKTNKLYAPSTSPTIGSTDIEVVAFIVIRIIIVFVAKQTVDVAHLQRFASLLVLRESELKASNRNSYNAECATATVFVATRDPPSWWVGVGRRR
jgi:hypothetical protein